MSFSLSSLKSGWVLFPVLHGKNLVMSYFQGLLCVVEKFRLPFAARFVYNVIFLGHVHVYLPFPI